MHIPIWYDCPVCGDPQSSDGEHFCGKCEEAYQNEMFDAAEREIKEKQVIIDACPCTDEGCSNCHNLYADILVLRGRYNEAAAMRNM